MLTLVLSLLFLLTRLLALKGVTAAGSRRDLKGMEQRRKRAARMFKQGVPQAEVARRLSVSRQSVSRWYADWQAGGTQALTGAGRAGRLPRLDEDDLARLDRLLRQGPRAHGYATDLWTLARVAEVIEATWGVTYHPGHVWKLLRRMNWSRQRPARRAVERDDEAIERWVADDWPRIKRGPADAGRGSSSRTSRGSRSFPR